jgi:DNA-binding FadR family transcriptional regulator
MTKARTYPRRGLHGAVVHEIGVRILRGELEPGDPVPSEDELGVALGTDLAVSRTVVREAVKVLVAKRLVETRPKRGTWVRPREEWNLLDPDVLAWQLEAGTNRRFLDEMLELRRMIEPQAARVAALRATEDQIEELAEATRLMAEVGEDPGAFLEPDLRFHALLLQATHNELLEHMASILASVLRILFTYSGRPPGAFTRAAALHAAVVEAIRDHDPDAAERALLELSDDTTANIDWAVEHAPHEGPGRAIRPVG